LYIEKDEENDEDYISQSINLENISSKDDSVKMKKDNSAN
jgi:hypothetical protein